MSEHGLHYKSSLQSEALLQPQLEQVEIVKGLLMIEL